MVSAPGLAARQTGPSAQQFLNAVGGKVGDPYVYGAAGPNQFDCSGLVQWGLEHIGLKNVPRTSEAQWAWVVHIPESALRPGDLIFEQWPGDNAAPGHVTIYTGNGRIEQAPQPGENVDVVPWSPGDVRAAGGRIVGYGRIPGMVVGGEQLGTGGGFGGLGGALAIPGQITSFFTSAAYALDWWLQPSNRIRVMAGVGGAVLLLSGVWMWSHVGGD
jgi:hypothetical protein